MQGEQLLRLDTQANGGVGGVNHVVGAVDQQRLRAADIDQQAALRALKKLPDQTTLKMAMPRHQTQVLRTAIHRARHVCAIPRQLAAADREARRGARNHTERIQIADKPCDKSIGGPLIDFPWRRQLRHAAFFHHQNPVAQGHRFALIMSHENRGDAQPAQELIQLAAQALAQLRVQCGQRLVEQQHPRARSQCTGQRNPLTLPPDSSLTRRLP